MWYQKGMLFQANYKKGSLVRGPMLQSEPREARECERTCVVWLDGFWFGEDLMLEWMKCVVRGPILLYFVISKFNSKNILLLLS